jgi:hypothetical protein
MADLLTTDPIYLILMGYAGHSMEEEYLSRCVVDTLRRTVHIYSNEGDKKTVECDTPEEFISVLNYVREHAPVDTVSYVDPI